MEHRVVALRITFSPRHHFTRQLTSIERSPNFISFFLGDFGCLDWFNSISLCDLIEVRDRGKKKHKQVLIQNLVCSPNVQQRENKALSHSSSTPCPAKYALQLTYLQYCALIKYLQNEIPGLNFKLLMHFFA